MLLFLLTEGVYVLYLCLRSGIHRSLSTKRGAFMLKKTSQKGFTIVELLIVIVVIGILAMLVLNTFNGVQAKARNTERQTDIKAIASQLEAYYADKGGYPKYTQINDATKLKAVLKGLDEGAAKAPQGSAFDLKGVQSTVKTDYGYVATDCGSADTDLCQKFILSYFTEGDDAAVVTVKSLN